MLIENFEICTNLDFCLSQLEWKSKLAVAISREHAYNNQLISASKFHCFKNSEIIYGYSLKFLIREDFKYLNNLNKFIQMASTAGLVERWRTESQIRSKYKHIEKIYGFLTFENFYVPYIEWFVLEISVTLILLLELLVHRKVRQANHSRIWTLIEMFIDPFRHFWLENKSFWH